MIRSYGLKASSAVCGAAVELTLGTVKKYLTGRDEIRLLDIGCGGGAFLKKLPPSFKSFGVDYNENAPIKVDISYEKLPFPNSSFDIVTAWQVFEHLENPFFAGREIERVLISGGLCIISVPNIRRAHSRLSFLVRGALPRWSNYNDHLFVPLKSVLKKKVFSGCVIRERKYADGSVPLFSSSIWFAKNEYYVFQKL